MTRDSSWPRGTITFLFSDIEGSTPLWDTHPSGMRVALARHDAILRAAVAENNGITIKTTGDGIHAVFTSPHDAVLAALAGQRALMAEPWESIQPDAIRVRTGIHSGEAELREGDYFGSAVNRAARIMSIGHGDQVLLSSTTATMVGDLDETLSLADLGKVRLRGLKRPEHVYQLVASDLPSEFPPLRTEAAVSSNLPQLLTSFVGREHEQREVTQLLAENRMLTLTGPGGTGKTRLSLEIAGDLQDHYTNGVWLVELAPLSDPAGIGVLIASMWGLRDGGPVSIEQALADYVRGKEMLLILDNCEHLVAASARLAADLLAAAPRLTILASSREGLGIPGETTYHLSTLHIPTNDVTDPQELQAFESVQLFLDRAQSVRPGFSITGQNAGAIGRIVRRLDGIPLAIELAAARLKLLPPEQLAARLDDRFRLLTGGARTALPRQQTLRALIDWSYDHLDPAEQMLFRQLGVFAGGWSLEAAEAVVDLVHQDLQSLGEYSPDPTKLRNLEGLRQIDTFDLLANLVNKSLVVMDDEAGIARFRMLETIRQYARDRLFESGAGPPTRNRHLDFYYDLVIDDTPVGEENVHLTVFSALGTKKMQVWVGRVRTEIDNVRAAVLWALQSDPARALAMSDKLPLFFVFEGPALEARQWLEEAIKAVEQLEPAGPEVERRRMALLLQGRTWEGNLQFGEGRHAEAAETLRAAAEMAHQHNFPGFQSLALALESLALSFLDQAGAHEIAAEALAIQETLDDPQLQALTLDALVRANMAAGDFTEAEDYYRKAISLLEEHHTILGGLMLVSLARLAMQSNNWKEAEELLLKARQGFTDTGSRLFRTMSESEIGHLKRFSGENDAAEAIYRRTIRDWQDLGHQAAVANQLETIAFISIHRGQVEKAAVLLGAAEAMREHIQVAMLPEERGVYESEVATLHSELGEERLRRLWEKGRMLDADKAIDFALSVGESDDVR